MTSRRSIIFASIFGLLKLKLPSCKKCILEGSSALKDIRRWGVNEVDETTRKEIYTTGSIRRIFNPKC